MRHTIARTLSRATTSTLLHDIPISRLQRTPPPHICPTCRITTTIQQQQQRRRQPPLRPFSTTTSHHAQTQTHYSLFPQTFPLGPPPQTPFTPDLHALRREYLQLQAQSHPDRAPQDRKAHFEALSSLINEAYKTLRDPLRRAQYLLAQEGIDVEDESAKLEDEGLLMEVMEAREKVDEVQDEEELQGLREENNVRIEGSVRVLEEAFAKKDLETAAQEAIKLRYWMNIEESIQGWEKGKGGGLVHH